ncbi:hypothetical protein [Chitinophaga sp. Cy-1792]|uniref:hypothetical protein n=1 Tax=Chitinophaga sp. Cy-1792 TaxID=2608339 RepID=UPI00141EA709|nr:hypothetical protein [Chitinophaga sp. Cy-1792]NIG53733.1 hypothetical protein [Chitinophaga sp. Cy-1792]
MIIQNQNRHHFVNWVNGMKIQRQHFMMLENAVLERLLHSSAITMHDLNYGLLSQGSASGSCELTLDINGNWDFRLLYCNGFSPDGLHIQLPQIPAVTGFVMPVLTYYPRNDIAATYLLMVEQHVFDRVPAGEVDTDELPYRSPITLPASKLLIVAAKDLEQTGPGRGQLIIARVKVENEKPFIDRQYIPPCLCVNAHYLLQELFEEIRRYLSEILLYASEIFRNIQLRAHQPELALCIMEICRGMSDLINPLMPGIDNLMKYQAPVHLFIVVNNIARNFRMFTTYRIGQWREQVLNYFAVWLDITPGVLDAVVWAATGTEYYHLDIDASFRPGLELLKLLHKLTKTISQLEYIGLKPDHKIFVKEELQQDFNSADNGSNKKVKWKFTD